MIRVRMVDRWNFIPVALLRLQFLGSRKSVPKSCQRDEFGESTFQARNWSLSFTVLNKSLGWYICLSSGHQSKHIVWGIEASLSLPTSEWESAIHVLLSSFLDSVYSRVMTFVHKISVNIDAFLVKGFRGHLNGFAEPSCWFVLAMTITQRKIRRPKTCIRPLYSPGTTDSQQ